MNFIYILVQPGKAYSNLSYQLISYVIIVYHM